MARTPVGFKRLLMRERRPALTESEHVSRCATSDAREPRSQLLGGFAERTCPKRRNTPAFPQVSGANSERPPPKTAQKSRTRGEIGARFLRNRPEPAGARPRAKPRQPSAPTRAQPAASRRTPLRPLFAWDNALAESFFKTLKRELVNGKGCKTREGAKQAVFKYIEPCCNTRKVHSSIGYNAPCDPKRDAA